LRLESLRMVGYWLVVAGCGRQFTSQKATNN
jgi:hypothetical protein